MAPPRKYAKSKPQVYRDASKRYYDGNRGAILLKKKSKRINKKENHVKDNNILIYTIHKTNGETEVENHGRRTDSTNIIRNTT